MIKFKKSLLKICQVRVIAFTSALGGSCRLIETDANGVDNEVRYKLPFAVARKMVSRYGNRMAVAIDAQAIFYGSDLICIDSFNTFDKNREPGSEMQDTPFIADIRAAMNEMNENLDWNFDGRLVFRLMESDPAKMPYLTSDGLMRMAEAVCIDLCGVRSSAKSANDDDDGDVVGVRHCVVAVDHNNNIYPSCPIWNDVMSLRNSRADAGEDGFILDSINEKFHLSMDFILSTAEVIGYHFGYAHLRPLQIPQLMVALGTVNLAKVDDKTRRRFISPFTVVEATAFLLGYLNLTDDLAVYWKIRQLLKHVLGRWSINGAAHTDNIEIQETFNGIDMIPHEVASDLYDMTKKRYMGEYDEDSEDYSEEE